MAYKDKGKQRDYMREYMKQRRREEDPLLREARLARMSEYNRLYRLRKKAKAKKDGH